MHFNSRFVKDLATAEIFWRIPGIWDRLSAMRCAALTLVTLVAATLAACRDERVDPVPMSPPRDGVTLILAGAAPHQLLRYRLTKGSKTATELVCDLDLKTEGRGGRGDPGDQGGPGGQVAELSGPMPALVVELETQIEDVLADGSARLRVAVVGTSVRDRPGSPVTSDVVRAQAAALVGVVITQTLLPDGQLTDLHLEVAASVSQGAR